MTIANCANYQKQSSICSLLVFKNKTCGTQPSRNTYQILKIPTAAQYSRTYLHLDYPSITSYTTMTSLQSMIFLLQSFDSFGKPTGNNSLNRLLSWMRLSSIKSKKSY